MELALRGARQRTEDLNDMYASVGVGIRLSPNRGLPDSHDVLHGVTPSGPVRASAVSERARYFLLT